MGEEVEEPRELSASELRDAHYALRGVAEIAGPGTMAMLDALMEHIDAINRKGRGDTAELSLVNDELESLRASLTRVEEVVSLALREMETGDRLTARTHEALAQCLSRANG